MPCEYQAEAKIQFPLPEYPQEGQYEDPIQYKVAVTRFRVDCVRVLVEHEEWVNCKQITDIAHASEAAHLQVEADKWRQEAEEAKDCRVLGEKRPRKWGQADTTGLSITEASTSGRKKRWKVCAYCAKQGKFLPMFSF